MPKSKAKLITAIISILLASVLYFISRFNSNIFYYLLLSFGLYGFISLTEDTYFWVKNNNSSQSSSTAKHYSKTNNLKEDIKQWQI